MTTGNPFVDIIITVGLNAAFNAIFGGSQDVSGPRLSDTRTTTSEYGAPIPIVLGNVRRAGQVLWGLPLREEERTETPGKKGGKGPSVTTYSYYGTWAVGFCRSGTSIRRLWFDKRLVYDANATIQNADGIIFRFYPGSETQEPDPAIEADKGVDDAPAYRDWCYIVFEDVPLEKYGRRIPSVEAEILNSVTGNEDLVEFALIDSPLSHIDNSQGGVDTTTGNVFVGDNVTTDRGVRVFNLLSKSETRQLLIGNNTALWGGAGGVFLRTTTFGNSRPISAVDAYSGSVIATFGFADTSVSWDMPTERFPFVNDDSACVMSHAGDYSYSRHANGLTTEGIGVLTVPGMRYVHHEEALTKYIQLIPGSSSDVFYCIGTNDSSTLTPGDSIIVLKFGVAGLGISQRVENEINSDLLVGGDSSFNRFFSFAVLDQTDDNLIVAFFGLSSAGTWITKIDPDTGAVLWSTEVDGAPLAPPMFSQSRVTGKYLGWYFGGTVYRINTLTGELHDEVVLGGGSAGQMYYDAFLNLLYWTDSDGKVRSFTWDQVTPGETSVADVVTAICAEAGLAPSDIDVTDLAGLELHGYVLEQQAPARTHVEPLRQAFFFDPTESDYVLKFVQRGAASARTITEDEFLDRGANQEFLVPTRLQEVELPRRYFVRYQDVQRDYETGLGRAQRILAPDPSVATKFEASLQLPIVFSGPDPAQQIAEKALFNAWAERLRVGFGLDWTHLDLDPTDVVTLSLDDGTSFIIRLTSTDVGADLSIDLSATEDQQSAYSSTGVGTSGTPPEEPTFAGGPTNLHVLNCPLLRDLDDEARVASHGYLYAGGFAAVTWGGCVVATSPDGAGYTAVGPVSDECLWGTTGNALGTPDYNEIFSTDEVNTITLYPVTREAALASVTQLEMVNGANRAALLKLNGEVEVIHFRDVADNGDGSYTLSGLLRGVRGTDTMAYDHTAGEVFILIEEDRQLDHKLALSRQNQSQYFRAVSRGAPIESGDVDVVVYRCRDLLPYAPVSVTGVYDGNDIDLACERRTRLNGELKDGFGTVPLNEDSEAYEWRVYDGPDGNLLRTLTSTTTEVTYLEADIVSDFGTPPSELTVKVHQVSAQVGVGFAHEHTLELA